MASKSRYTRPNWHFLAGFVTCFLVTVIAYAGYQTMKKPIRNEQLIQAVSRGDYPTTKRLLSEGADPKVEKGFLYPTTPLLFLAIETGHTEIVRLLLDKGESPDRTDCYAIPAISCAISGKRTEIVKLLIDRGAEVSVCAKPEEGGPMVLTQAKKEGNPEIVPLLKAAGARE